MEGVVLFALALLCDKARPARIGTKTILSVHNAAGSEVLKAIFAHWLANNKLAAKPDDMTL